MTLLDNGPHTLTVQPRVPVQTPHGVTMQADGDPVVIRGIMQPYSAAQSTVDGKVTLTQRRWLSRTWVGDSNSLITSYDGMVWELSGDPQQYQSSPGTQHWEVVLSKVR
jgi:hypothetical protein